MKLQRYEQKNQNIREAFEELKQKEPERLCRRIDISFCSDCFGLEPVTDSIERLADLGYEYIEIPGNYGGPDSGHHTHLPAILNMMERRNMRCSGLCPTDTENLALTTQEPVMKQSIIDHVRGNLEFCKALGGSYYLITAGPCGVGERMDEGDWDRSVLLLSEMGSLFAENGIHCAVEPLFRGLVPIVHDVAEVKQYIKDVNHPNIRYIFGDLQHFLIGEEHIGEAILNCGEQLLCLHLRDTMNGLPIGYGMMDIDTVIRALYLIGFNKPGRFVVGEPNVGGYSQYGDFFNFGVRYPEKIRRQMAADTIDYFREREEEVLG